MGKTLLFLHLLILGVVSGLTQSYKFKNYNLEDGLCHNVIYDMIQDKNGFLWLATGEGFCRYDGFEFKSASMDTLQQGYVAALFKDSQDWVWIGYSSGALYKYDGNAFELVVSKEDIGGGIVGITQLGDRIVAFTQNKGAAIIESTGKFKITQKGLEGILSTTLIKLADDKLALGTFEGLKIIGWNVQDTSFQLIKSFEEIEFTKVQDIDRHGDLIWLVTQDMGVYSVDVSDDNYTLKQKFVPLKLEYINLQAIHVNDKNEIWISTFGEGVLRLEEVNDTVYNKVNYSDQHGLFKDVKSVFKDSEGNFWFGSYGNGLYSLTDESILYYAQKNKNENTNVTTIFTTEQTSWFGYGDGILAKKVLGTDQMIYYDALNGKQITTLFQYHGKLWIGTKASGVFIMDIETNKITPYIITTSQGAQTTSMSMVVNHIQIRDSVVWVSTQNGLYRIAEDKTLQFNMDNGMPHNTIYQTYIDYLGRTWIAAKSKGLYYVDTDLKVKFKYTKGAYELEYVAITGHGKNLWAASLGYGVFKFNDNNVENVNAQFGIKSDYCYSLFVDTNDDLIIGHRQGMSLVNLNNYLIKTYDRKDGIKGDFNPRAIAVDKRNRVICGTTEGIVVYQPDKVNSVIPKPVPNLTKLKINDEEFDFGKPVVLPFDNYRIRFEFIGLLYGDPASVSYQYKLEGHDETWSDLSTVPFAPYGKVSDGEYIFKLDAYNKQMQRQDSYELRILVNKPFWKKLWFIILMALLLIVAVVIIIKIRERKQRQLQEYLENELDLRTREVVLQKEEIELKNKDITDSINYAQRIQASILPSPEVLNDHFSGNFIFFQPRDIVSGDFYWFGKTKNNKFLVICADSTGHGVPGAFMSMIGTILLKDICSRSSVTKPSEVLCSLDIELSKTLNQNKDQGGSNDGMDITVCEIDMETSYVRVASAMRPIIVFQDGEMKYVKGSRNSVGGHDSEESKQFEDHGFNLKKGDQVYMFSDGYPDQFGGPLEKKFKMVRLKNLLLDMHNKGMDEQAEIVKEVFFEWMGDYEQIDDVLFMGLKI